MYLYTWGACEIKLTHAHEFFCRVYWMHVFRKNIQDVDDAGKTQVSKQTDYTL
jgi:hypothetical protein